MSQEDQADITAGSGTPAWLNAVLRIGAISCIAMWFVYRLTTVVETRLTNVENILNNTMQVQAAFNANQEGLKKDVQEHRAETHKFVSIARQICVNTAKSQEQIRACVYD